MLTFNNLKLTGGIGYSTVGPRSGSIYFDGSASYLTVPNVTELAFGTGDFTVECWIYPTSTLQFTVIYLTSSFQFFTFNGALYIYDNGAQTSGGTITLNTWQHIAITRSGTSLNCFINGKIVNTQVSSTNFTSGTNYVGFNGGGFSYGYISNLRVVKGTAVYISNFIPSVLDLPGGQSANVYGTPSAVIPAGNTSLLLNTYNEPFYTQDSSSNVKILSQTGNLGRTSANAFYTAGSRYFNGTSEYLTVPSSSLFQLGTNDFTIEFWFYWDGTTFLNTNQYTIISNIVSADNTTWDLQYYNGQWRFVAWSIPSFVESPIGTAGTFSGNTWNHLAVTRSAGVGNMWLNGVNIGTNATFTNNLSTTRGLQIGWNGYNNYWKGYISNLRIVKGTAVYNANFIPSISVLPATQAANAYGSVSSAIPAGNTSLLLNAGGLSLLDSSLNYSTIASVNSTALSSSTNNPFYTKGSIYFNGSANYLTANYGSLYTFTGDFTIEMWANPNSASGNYALWCAGTETTNRYVTYVSNSKISTNMYGSTTINYTDVSVPVGTWSHIAFVRTGSTINVFVNGIRSSNTDTQAGTVGNGPIKIGADSGNTTNFSGYLSNFRVVKDTAVYTANFTPSISILPATQGANVYGSISSIIPAGNTSLLLNTGGLSLLDSSIYRNLVIPTGNVFGYSISPF